MPSHPFTPVPTTLVIQHGRVPLAQTWQPGTVAIAGDALTTVGTPQRIPAPAELDAAGCHLLPGLVDVHVHGAVGCDTMDADPAALARMARFFAHHGVTAFLPTTMTADRAATLAAVRAVAAAGSQPHANGAAILGIHLEGPFLSPRFPGAQLADAIRPPDLAEFAALCAAGPVRLITLAPEVDGAYDLIAAARSRGIVAVMGHSAATYAQAEAGVAAGIRQATHTYNAMTGLHHREPGALGCVLSNDAVFAQLIADNVHVHPAAMRVLARCKGLARTVLITDAMRAAGLPPGSYELGGQPVTVADGQCRLADGTLAGSVLTLEQGVANFAAAAGLDIPAAWQAGSLTPLASLGLDDRRGRIAPGQIADVVLVEDTGAVVATVVQGRVVYLRDAGRLRSDSGDHQPDGPGSL